MMEKQADSPKTLGQAIDEVIQALTLLDEGSRVTAVRAACDHLRINLKEVIPNTSQLPNDQATKSLSGAGPFSSQFVDIKSLRNEKQPSSANEMAALVAYYLSELAPEKERKATVNAEDMKRFFKQGGYPLSKHMDMLLPNAKNAGYFEGAGRGEFKLNAVGHNLVAHNLPRAEGTAVSKKRRPKKTSNRQRRTKTKGHV